MNKSHHSFLVALASTLLSLTACSLPSIPDKNMEMTSEMNTLIQLEGMNDLSLHTADVYVNFLETIKNNDPKDSIYGSSNGPTLDVNIDGVILQIEKQERTTHPRNISINFGVNGVTLRNGNVFKGRIFVHETAPMTETNATRTYGFSQFSINDRHLKGLNVVTYLGRNSDLKPMWKTTSKDTLSPQNGSTITWNAERTRTRLLNPSTLLPTDYTENDIDSIRYDPTQNQEHAPNVKFMMYWDNPYSVQGTASGIHSSGKTYTIQTMETPSTLLGNGYPFCIRGKCLYKVGKDLLLLDFGDQLNDTWVTTTLHGISLNHNLLDQSSKY